MVGHVDDHLRRRHMVCTKCKPESWACRGCAHRAVHDEMLTCKTVAPCGGRCTPVSEANEGCAMPIRGNEVERRFRHVC